MGTEEPAGDAAHRVFQVTGRDVVPPLRHLCGGNQRLVCRRLIRHQGVVEVEQNRFQHGA
jgi:hypothetical protein